MHARATSVHARVHRPHVRDNAHRMHRSTDDSITLQYLSLIHGSAVFGLASFFPPPNRTTKGLSTSYCFWYRNLGMLSDWKCFVSMVLKRVKDLSEVSIDLHS